MILLTHFHFASVLSYYMATCNTHYFFLPYLNFHVSSIFPIGFAVRDY